MPSKMQPRKSETFTYQTRPPLEASHEAILVHCLVNHVERKLFADMAAGKNANDLKSPYIIVYSPQAMEKAALWIQNETALR